MTYYGSTPEQYLVFFLAIVCSVAGAKVFYFLLKKYGGMVASATQTKFDDLVIAAIEKPLLFGGFILGLSIGYNFLAPDAALISKLGGSFSNVLNALIIIGITWLAIKLLDGLVAHFASHQAPKSKMVFDYQLLVASRRLLKFGLVALALVIILSTFSIDVFPVLAGLGIGGLAIAIAAQKTVEDVFGGLSIFFSKPFTIGDTVKVKGIEGDVLSIGLRHIRIRDTDGRIVTIPNAQAAQDIIVNISSEIPGRKVSFTISLPYSTPAAKAAQAAEIMGKIVEGHPGTVHDSGKTTAMVRFGQGALEILFTYYISNKGNLAQTQGAINLEIKKRFDAAGIEFALPTNMLYMPQRRLSSKKSKYA